MAVLNSFKTITANVTTTANTIYTAPTGYTTVVLLAQVANTGNITYAVSANHIRGGVPTALIANALIPVNDAINVLSGKLILNTADALQVFGNTNPAVGANGQILLSVLETANP